jgi:hypothetical protein
MHGTGITRRLSPGCIVLAGLLAALPMATGQPPTTVPPGTPVTISVTPAAPAPPSVSITLGARHGHVIPHRQGFSHTGGGNIDVAQPSADTVVVTMTGVAVAGAHPCKGSCASMEFDLDQAFEVTFEKPAVKKAKVTVESRVIGLLRGGSRGGSAEESSACVTIAGEGPGVSLCAPPHSVCGCDDLSINCHEGPVNNPITAGKYTLQQTFRISASHAQGICGKAASAECAPDPALDPLWISYWEPFHGAIKKDFGFQATIKVAPEDELSAPAKEPARLPK